MELPTFLAAALRRINKECIVEPPPWAATSEKPFPEREAGYQIWSTGASNQIVRKPLSMT
jgi:hypothetical protein